MRGMVVGHKTDSQVRRIPHARVSVGQVLADEVDALVNPGCLLDMLHHLRHGHDGGPRVPPVGPGRLPSSPDQLEEDRHEDILVQLLCQGVEVRLRDAHDVVVHIVLVVLLALVRPHRHILLDLEHPLDVQAHEPLEGGVALGLAEVLREAEGQRLGRLHGRLPHLRIGKGIRPTGAQLDEGAPEGLDAVVLEEVGLLIDG
mmetsp:Transcript_48699/g.139240  ORF Transcript_48699/g.139240 Transcript_48699/m.139240 type:complete len:201 (-) Transcript_48699:808-1410(-)